jgi:hypothetical protein
VNPTTWLSNQTRYGQTKDIYMFQIMKGSIIWCQFTSINNESSRFGQNEFRFKTKTLRLKPFKHVIDANKHLIIG